MIRRFLGKPGTVRRWIAGSTAVIGVCAAYFVLTFDITPLGLALMGVIVAFVARRVLVGDEDEFNASLQQSVVRVAREGVPLEQHDVPVEPDLWFRRGMRGLDGAPPPPVADEAEYDTVPFDQGTHDHGGQTQAARTRA